MQGKQIISSDSNIKMREILNKFYNAQVYYNKYSMNFNLEKAKKKSYRKTSLLLGSFLFFPYFCDEYIEPGFLSFPE